MNIQDYNFELRDMGLRYRIYFTLGGKRCYRSINKSHKACDGDVIECLMIFLETGSCEVRPLPAAFCSIRDAIRQYNASDDLSAIYDELLDSYTQEIKEMQDKLSDTRTKLNDAMIRISNQKSIIESYEKRDISTDLGNLSSVLSEEDYWFVMSSLNEYYNSRYSNNQFSSGKQAALKRVIEANPYDKDKESRLREQLKRICKSTTNPLTLAREFKPLGLEVVKQGDTHYKVYPKGRPQISIPLSVTPSDNRSIDNFVQELMSKVFR